MKTKLVAMGWAVMAGLWAQERTVTVCMESGNADLRTVTGAKGTASKMFSSAGVRIHWRTLRSCPADAIQIHLSTETPRAQLPGAFAFALPYEGTKIVIFYDRLPGRERREAPSVLAHVLVHEVTHILQGVSRHSTDGVMKAHWDHDELSTMPWKPLPFTSADVTLIHRGLDSRASRLLASR